MKTSAGFGMLLLIASALVAAQPDKTNTVADLMVQNFLKAEAARLDDQFLAGVTNRAQWEERRGELRRQYGCD